MRLEFIIARLMKNLYPLQVQSEAPRPKGRGFPVRYFPFIVCPLTPPSRAGLTGHLPAKNATKVGKLTLNLLPGKEGLRRSASLECHP